MFTARTKPHSRLHSSSASIIEFDPGLLKSRLDAIRGGPHVKGENLCAIPFVLVHDGGQVGRGVLAADEEIQASLWRVHQLHSIEDLAEIVYEPGHPGESTSDLRGTAERRYITQKDTHYR